MKGKMSVVLVLILVLSSVLPALAFADGDYYQDPLREKYEKVYRNMGFMYELPYGLAKRDGNLPYGLAKRGGNLPHGLAKRGVMPMDFIKTKNMEAFIDFVEAVIEAYDDGSDLFDDLEDLLKEDPLNLSAIMALLDEIFDETMTFAEWAWAQAEAFGADEDQLEELEALLDEEPIDEEAVEEWLDELEEAYELALRIAEVYEILEMYDADQELIDDIEALLDGIELDDEEEWDDIDELLEALIMGSDIYADAWEMYEDLVEDIELILDDVDFEWPDTETGESFMETFEMYDDLVEPSIELLNEANRVLGLLEGYLELGDVGRYSIEEGLELLEDLKEELQELIDTLDFGKHAGDYDPGLKIMFEDLVEQIEELSDPTIFDIIALKGSVDEMLAEYEGMRYIAYAERQDFRDKRDEVLDYVYDDLSTEEKELYDEIEAFELPYGSMMRDYYEFLELYDAFMDLVD